MPDPILREHEGAVLALNNAHAAELSWLEPPKLSSLLTQAFYARRIGTVEAFLIALDETADYDSPNYQWFRTRYGQFIYVDRIAVAGVARRRGLAQLLYRDLFTTAVAAGRDLVVCEVNAMPPNPASDRLHAALGFGPVGEATIHDGKKTVRYLARKVG
jgi:predicted GNAT superfamily acetyltransferase